ncbi:MAG: ABC transporter ATP-binding protein [Myxococcales bacterium]|nr:ABC transporter ATP-binding protein [Myxococcales bacterium]
MTRALSDDLRASCWPVELAGEALSALARAPGLGLTAGTGASPGEPPQGVLREPASFGRWIDTAARSLQIELEPFHPTYQKLEVELEKTGPKVLSVSHEGSAHLLLYVRRRGASACLLGRDGALRAVLASELCAALRSGLDVESERRVERLLDRANVVPARRSRARDAILREALGGRVLEAGWIVALPPSAPFVDQLRQAGLPRRAAAIVACQVALQGLAMLAWWVVGKGALEGRLEPGWLVAWALLLTTAVPLRSLTAWWQGAAALEVSVLLKRRMLAGALHLEPEETRHQGSGQLLGRVIESEALESLVTTGALGSVLAIVEVLVAVVILASGPSGLGGAALFAACAAVVVVLSWGFLQRLRAWTVARLEMTHDLVERMVGHRTRLAQEPRATWHLEEDAQLSRYVERSAAMDRLSTVLAAAPGVWLLVGLSSIVPSFVSGQTTGAGLALGVGGVLLAHGALAKLSGGVGSLLGAQVAWSQAGELFRAGGREEQARRAALVAVGMESAAGGALVEARDLTFRYPSRPEPVLRGVGLRVQLGDRLLLQGPSGGGKSTLGALLTGLRAPETGLLLLGGLDRHTLGGHGWRQRVVAAPQFHENHVLSATFAFNLLMGRAWPARQEDLDEATTVCEELGLGGLLERMPAGLMQMVGETGWQLSHGERSRLFIARALLQRADLVVLDESFAALDPVTLERALRCVLGRARTLVVIAHP